MRAQLRNLKEPIHVEMGWLKTIHEDWFGRLADKQAESFHARLEHTKRVVVRLLQAVFVTVASNDNRSEKP